MPEFDSILVIRQPVQQQIITAEKIIIMVRMIKVIISTCTILADKNAELYMK